MSREQIAEYNPSLRRPVISGKKRIPKNYVFKFPVDHNSDLNVQYALIPEDLKFDKQVRVRWYTVRRGDTLSRIALRYDTTIARLRAINDLASDRILAGQQLRQELLLLNVQSRQEYWQLALPEFVSLIFLAFAYRAEALTGDGAVAAYLIGLIIFGSGGWSWIIPLLIFLVSSSLLAKYQNPDAPGSKRNISQVFANGSVALTIALLHFYLSLPNAFILYLAAIAAATADTWATEIGFFSPRQPVSIATLKKVEKGSSGGITLLGTAGSVIGAAVIGLTGMLWGLSSLEAAVITVAGFTGSILDSILGATIQGKFQCPECNKITEKRIHCGIKSIKIEGFAWLDNNLVNFINTAGGIITVILIFSALK